MTIIKMKYVFSILSLLISINVYSQVNVMDIDTNKTQVNINNYGTLIENKGTVNIGKQGKTEKLEMPKENLGEITDSEDDGIHYVYTDDYRFAGDKVKINGKVYRNVDISKSNTGNYLFKLIRNEAYACYQNMYTIEVDNRRLITRNKRIYLCKYKNTTDYLDEFVISDNILSYKMIESANYLDVIDGVVIDYHTLSEYDRRALSIAGKIIGLIIFIAVILLLIASLA